ncbi:MAG: HPr family phosphocarrier protein [Chthoniobacterales bacterium]
MMLWRTKREPVKITRDIVISNKHGFHARPAAAFVRRANSFRSQIFILRNGERYDAMSLMDILRGQFECGATAQLEAFGIDAEAAVDALCKTLLDLRDQEASE